MASSEIELVQPKKPRQNFISALVSAVLEWFLIFFLFVDAAISFVITKFARGCKLQTPCLLCSRLDHVLGKEKMGYYWDLMCKNHKSEVSSLVLCHAHDKLVDVRMMCENCLFSFATINKSNAETYRLLVGKLGEDLSSDVDQDHPCLVDDFLSRKNCACCNQQWVPRAHTHAKELIQTRFDASEAAESESPLFSQAIEHDHEVSNLRRDRSVSITDGHSRKSIVIDPLSHIGYTELKINSDTESEALHSDDEYGLSASARVAIRERDLHKRFEPQIVTLDDDLVSEKLLDPAHEMKHSSVESHEKEESVELGDCKTQEYVDAIGHGLEELNWHEVGKNAESIATPFETTAHCESPVDVIEEATVGALEHFESIATPVETTVHCESPLDVIEEAPVEALEHSESTATPVETTVYSDSPLDAIEEAPIEAVEHSASIATPVETTVYFDSPLDAIEEASVEALKHSESIATPVETTVYSDSPLDVIEEAPVEALEHSTNIVTKACEIEETPVVESESNEVLEREAPSEPTSETGLETSTVASDSVRQAPNSLDLGDAYKLAVDNRGKQLSGSLADHWLGKDSSRVTEDLKVLLSQLSSKGGFELPMSPKLSINSDDQKTLEPSSSIGMQILQKKFSLERNESGLSLDGSIISEIEGESVVDRLKRQVEHDKKIMTALYKELEEERNASAVATNQAMAMITRLQEEKAALHMEALQYLRMMEEQAEYDDDELQKSNDLLTEKEKEVQDLEAELEYYKKKFPNERYLEDLSETSGDIRITDIGVDNSEYIHPISGKSDSPILEFEDEKEYILRCVKKLERTLDLLSKDDERETSASGQDFRDEETELNGREMSEEPEMSKPGSADLSQVMDLASIRTTVLSLNKRLEAVEEDRKLLEHTMNSLRNGDEGVQFVQDIASHLQELRKIAMQKDQLLA